MIKKLTEIPNEDELLVLDTNVWLLLTDPYISDIRNKEIVKKYSKFVEDLLGKTKPGYFPFQLIEATHVIEKYFYFAYKSKDSKITLKQFRAIEEEQERVNTSVSTALGSIRGIGELMELHLNTEYESRLNGMLTGNRTLDAYDSAIAVAAVITKASLVTDDRDFKTAGLTIYTAH